MATINKRTKLTKPMIEKLAQALEQGCSVAGACGLVGISHDRVVTILNSGGKEGDKLNAVFNNAQSIAELNLCQKVMRDGNARDALAMLTARFDSWDKKSGIKYKDNNIKAEALLARMSAVPEQIKKLSLIHI